MIGLTLVATIAFVAVGVPELRREQRALAAAEQQARAVSHRRAIQALQREQQPRLGRTTQTARPAMLRDLEAAILADARARGVAGSILHAGCEPSPKRIDAVAPEHDPSVARGNYACLAVTTEIDRSAATSGGELGYPYRASLDFATGRFALCKVAGSPDPVPDPEVTTPAVCLGET